MVEGDGGGEFSRFIRSPRKGERKGLASMAGVTAYLVIKRGDGFGDVFPLTPGQRYTIGRATSNSILLKDDQCSREHAELFYFDGQSLNQTADQFAQKQLGHADFSKTVPGNQTIDQVR